LSSSTISISLKPALKNVSISSYLCLSITLIFVYLVNIDNKHCENQLLMLMREIIFTYVLFIPLYFINCLFA
jgi:hypothetical protein